MGRMRGNVEQPQGWRYLPDALPVADEHELLAHLVDLDYGEVRLHGQVARRVVRHYGMDYDFASARVTPGDPVPAWLEDARTLAGDLLGRTPEELAEVLVTRYPPGAAIGWHRDAPPFGDVVGVSLAAAGEMRFQHGSGAERRVFQQELAPRSAYVLSGRARTAWQHSIPAVAQERFSLTFRTLRRSRPAP